MGIITISTASNVIDDYVIQPYTEGIIGSPGITPNIETPNMDEYTIQPVSWSYSPIYSYNVSIPTPTPAPNTQNETSRYIVEYYDASSIQSYDNQIINNIDNMAIMNLTLNQANNFMIDPNIKSIIKDIQISGDDPIIEDIFTEDTSTIQYVSSDPYAGYQYYLQKINAYNAWDIYNPRSQKDIIVAVLDTGIDFNHEDLQNNIYTNLKEIPNNNIDDDNNGYIDDVHGWNFINKNNNPTDDNGHGTHIAGIIAATQNNNKGITGISPKNNIKILPIKFLDNNNRGWISDASLAIRYANKMNADVQSHSWTTTSKSDLITVPIRDSPSMIVCAAGNSAYNIDNTRVYPAFYAREYNHVITVGSIDTTDKLSYFSNYGNTIEISSYGSSVYSTTPNNRYNTKSGTSQATPMVSATIAMMKSLNLTTPNKDIKSKIITSADTLTSLNGKVKDNKRLNIYGALKSMTTENIQPEALKADFTTETREVSPGQTFTIMDISKGSPDSWEWYMGSSIQTNKVTSTSQHLTLTTNPKAGKGTTYAVKLIVRRSSDNKTSMCQKTSYIKIV